MATLYPKETLRKYLYRAIDDLEATIEVANDLRTKANAAKFASEQATRAAERADNDTQSVERCVRGLMDSLGVAFRHPSGKAIIVDDLTPEAQVGQ